MNAIRQVFVLAFVLTWQSWPAPAAAQNPHHVLGAPELTVLITPSVPWVQEQIVQSVRLESAQPFDALDVTLGDIADAEVVELVRPSLREFESWGVRGHVYETVRAIFPRRSGPLALPAVHIRGATLDAHGKVTRFERLGKPVTLAVRPATAALGDGAWLVARAVTMSERWSTPPDALHAGELVKRTISVRAQGVSGEHLPPLTMAASMGIMVAAHEPRRRTEITDAGLVGHLEQDFEIRVATAQTTDISGLYLPWWDGESATPRRATVRAYRIEPLPADVDAMVARILHDAQTRQLQKQQSLILATAGLILLGTAIIALARLPGRIGRRTRRLLTRAGRWLFGPRAALPDLGYRADR